MLGGAWYDNATKAIPLLEAAIARDPKFALAYSMIGHCHLVLHDPVKAKEAIDAALRISPNSAEAHLYLASYYIGTMEDYSAGEKVSRAGERVLAIADFFVREFLANLRLIESLFRRDAEPARETRALARVVRTRS